MKLLFKVNKYVEEPCQINAEAITHEYYAYAVCEHLGFFLSIPFALKGTKVQGVRRFYFVMSSIAKGEEPVSGV